MREHYRVLVQFTPLWQMEMYFIGSDRCLFWNWVIRESDFSIPFHSWTPIQPSYWGMENPIKARVWNCGRALGNSWGLGTLANSHCKGWIPSNVELLTGAIFLEGFFFTKAGPDTSPWGRGRTVLSSWVSHHHSKNGELFLSAFPQASWSKSWVYIGGYILNMTKLLSSLKSWGCSKEIIFNS